MRSPAQHGEQLPELDERVIFAFLLTLGAGLATSLGSLLGVMSRRFNPGLLTLALSFSAGVMLFISFVEIFPKARLILTSALGNPYWIPRCVAGILRRHVRHGHG